MTSLLDQVSASLNPRKVGIVEFSESDEFCGRRLYPRQKLLLKLMFLEELTGQEEDVLNYWIQGGRRNSEIQLSPLIRERVQHLRDNGWDHFKEIMLVGGRRSSKGFVTAIAMTKVMYDALQLQDPGRYYDVDPTKNIHFSCIATSEQQAREAQFGDLQNTIEGCAAMEKYVVKSLENEVRIATEADLQKVNKAKVDKRSVVLRDIARLRAKALSSNASSLRGNAILTAAQPLWSKVWTPDGWTTIGELQVGSVIFGSDGKKQTVQKLHPKGVQKAFRVTFSDGSSTVCNDDHLWTLHQKRRGVKTKSLSKFANDLTKKNGKQIPYAKWSLPQQPTLDEPTYMLPNGLHPYLLGVMLGDGSITRSTARLYNEDPSIIEAVRQVLPTDHSLIHRHKSSQLAYEICGTNGYNRVIRALKEAGAWGHLAPVKFIPERCFQMTKSDRLALLQGLLDTDGSVNGTSVRFGSSSRDLAEGVIALVRTLGGYGTLHVAHREKETFIATRRMAPQGDFYEVCISGLDATTLFRSELKKKRAKQYARYTKRNRRLVSVEEIGKVEMQCITVSNPDGLYITDDFIVTHNCIDEMAHMIPGESRLAADQVYDALTPSFDQFGRGAMLFLNSSPYTRIGKFYEKFEESMDTTDGSPTNPLIFAMRYPSWALFEGYQDDPERRFKRAITVSPDWDLDRKVKNQFYYSSEDRRNIPIAKQEELSNPEKYKVERRGQFAEVIDAYLNPVQVDRMFEGRPFRNTETGNTDYVMMNTNWDDSTNRYRYKAHVDPSSTTAGFGFAMGHVEEYETADGQTAPHVVFDIIYRWNPKQFGGGVIDWKEVMDQILVWVDLFRPYEITFDQYNSAEPIQAMRQKLRENHIGETQVYEKTATAEHNWNRSEIFKTALYQGLVHAPSDIAETQYASQELKFLQQKNTAGRFPRVDKQDIGPVQTKDIADCIMEVVNSLIGNIIGSRMRESLSDNLMAVGAGGGYRIGGSDYEADPRLRPYYGSAGRGGEQSKTGAGGRVGSGRAGRSVRREWGQAPSQRRLPNW